VRFCSNTTDGVPLQPVCCLCAFWIYHPHLPWAWCWRPAAWVPRPCSAEQFQTQLPCGKRIVLGNCSIYKRGAARTWETVKCVYQLRSTVAPSMFLRVEAVKRVRDPTWASQLSGLSALRSVVATTMAHPRHPARRPSRWQPGCLGVPSDSPMTARRVSPSPLCAGS
jgi:hypothetical protein